MSPARTLVTAKPPIFWGFVVSIILLPCATTLWALFRVPAVQHSLSVREDVPWLVWVLQGTLLLVVQRALMSAFDDLHQSIESSFGVRFDEWKNRRAFGLLSLRKQRDPATLIPLGLSALGFPVGVVVSVLTLIHPEILHTRSNWTIDGGGMTAALFLFYCFALWLLLLPDFFVAVVQRLALIAKHVAAARKELGQLASKRAELWSSCLTTAKGAPPAPLFSGLREHSDGFFSLTKCMDVAVLLGLCVWPLGVSIAFGKHVSGLEKGGNMAMTLIYVVNSVLVFLPVWFCHTLSEDAKDLMTNELLSQHAYVRQRLGEAASDLQKLDASAKPLKPLQDEINYVKKLGTWPPFFGSVSSYVSTAQLATAATVLWSLLSSR